jgi:hypothetical protein
VVTRYKYRQYKTKAHRFTTQEREGHQIAYTVRTDIMIPESQRGKTSYLPRCTCGWKDPSGSFVAMRVLYARFDAHIAQVDAQGTLWPLY